MIKLSSKIGGGIPKLAPDLDWPKVIGEQAGPAGGPHQQAAVTISATETAVLSLTGKYLVEYLNISALSTSTQYTVRLSVDGEDIWSTTLTTTASTSALRLYEGIPGNNPPSSPFKVDSGMTLYVSSPTDTSVTVLWLARPIK